MKIILLLPLLWSAIAGETNSNCMDLEDSDAQLVYTTTEKSCKIEAQLMIFCINEINFKSDSNISLKSVNCTSQEHSTSAMNIPTMSTQANITHAEMTTHPILCKCQEAGSAASIGLGALIGLLVVLLALVTIGWIWTCWTIKRRARITTNSSDNTINLSSNPSYRAGYQQTLQDHPLPTPTPTYETIPALTNTMDGIKLDLAEREGDVTDDSNNREDTYHKLNRAQRDDKTREIKDQTHRSGQTQGKERVTGSSSGTGLLEIEQSYATTSTECLLPKSAVSSEEEERSASIGERSLEKDIENSSAKKNNKELDGTVLEHNGYHGPAENVENEQDLPRKRATPRDYEQAAPSKN